MESERDAFVIGHVEKLVIQLPRRHLPREWPPVATQSPAGTDSRPDITRAAIAALQEPTTCLYLGRRYGLTPHSRLSWQPFEESALGALAPGGGTLCEAMSWLARQVGQEKAARDLSGFYSELDLIEPDAEQELSLLSRLAGHVFATGSYSARIQTALGRNLTVVQNENQAGWGPLRATTQRATLLLLHGSEQDFQNALLGKTAVHSFPKHRPKLSERLNELLREIWIVLGTDEKADATFHLAASNVSCDLGLQQRPIFVVDPRPEEEVAIEWPREALRHVRMTSAQFMSKALAAK